MCAVTDCLSGDYNWVSWEDESCEENKLLLNIAFSNERA